MMKLPQKICPVVDRAVWIDRLGRAGARFIQLRIKDLGAEDLLREVRQAKELARRHGVSLVLNDYWQIAADEALDWVHLGQEDLDTADIAAIRRAGLRLGVSTHSHEELDRALSLEPDYVALGPVWPTTLKKMIWGAQGTERLAEWKGLIGERPLVAIGGITAARVPACMAAGADCVAAVSDFVLQEDPETQVRVWLDAAERAA
ncbi:thiamine phosphate synthase [Acetobacter sp. AN02]|uniref:thiamine phosphate synthase n=1 Tax=Acetobacter sp. AN02 TaxID=2894186 RepID=UPI0024344106|nr:thiamine phosphate synthase [Acetobacter sp. AN02]MDG6093684.1 thiamine phosphate synthase [Acetobacter sp. AN02]